MKEFLLSLILIAASIYGFFIMGKIEKLNSEVRSDRHKPHPRKRTLKKRKK